jgi:hypothetical protein
MNVAAPRRKFNPYDKESLAAWWIAVQEDGRATVHTRNGGAIYVANTFAEIREELAKEKEPAFLYLRVVSWRGRATPFSVRDDLEVNSPPAERIFPVDLIASIAPVVDALGEPGN